MCGDTPLGRRSNSTSRSSKPVPGSAWSFSLGPRPTFHLLGPVKSSPKMPHPDSGERPLSVFWQRPEVRLLSLAGAACGGACGSRSLCHPPGQADPLHRHDELCLRGGDGNRKRSTARRDRATAQLGAHLERPHGRRVQARGDHPNEGSCRLRQTIRKAGCDCRCRESTQRLLRGAEDLLPTRIPKVQHTGGSNELVGTGVDVITSVPKYVGLEVRPQVLRRLK